MIIGWWSVWVVAVVGRPCSTSLYSLPLSHQPVFATFCPYPLPCSPLCSPHLPAPTWRRKEASRLGSLWDHWGKFDPGGLLANITEALAGQLKIGRGSAVQGALADVRGWGVMGGCEG